MARDYIILNGARCYDGTEIIALPAIEQAKADFGGRIKAGERMILKIFRRGDDGLHLALYSEEERDDFHDLDGNVDHGHGWWVQAKDLEGNFSPAGPVKVATDFKFKGKNLNGMKGRVIAHLKDSGHLMLELTENVGGSSGDGMGKKGHCILIEKRLTREI